MKTLGMGSKEGNARRRSSATSPSEPHAKVSEPLAHAFGLLKSSGIQIGLWRIRLDGVLAGADETLVADAVGHLGAVTSLPCGDVVFLQFSGLFGARRGRPERRWQPYLVVGMIAERLERLSLGGGVRAVVTFRAARADEFANAADLIASLNAHATRSVTIDMPGHHPAEGSRVRSARAAGMVPVNVVAADRTGGDHRSVAAGGR